MSMQREKSLSDSQQTW